jgi:hypothetical protein
MSAVLLVGQTHLSETAVSLIGRDPGVPMSHSGAAATRGRTHARDVAPVCSRPQSVACAPVPLHDSPKIANKLQSP